MKTFIERDMSFGKSALCYKPLTRSWLQRMVNPLYYSAGIILEAE